MSAITGGVYLVAQAYSSLLPSGEGKSFFDIYLREAEKCLNDNDYSGAVTEMENAFINADPKQKLPTFIKLVNLYILTSQYGKAERFIKIAQKEYPGSSELWSLLGVVYFEISMPKEAQAAFQRALELDPANPEANYFLGFFNSNRAQLQKAADGFRLKIKKNPQEGALYDQLGQCLMVLGSYEEAQQAFNDALKHTPYLAQTYVNLGAFYLVQGNLPEAERMFNEAIKRNSQFIHSYLNLGVLYVSKKDYEKAEEYFRKVISLNERSADGHFNLGMVLLITYRPRAAEEHLEKALLLHYPDGLEFFNAAMVCFSREDADRGLRWLRAAHDKFKEAGQEDKFFEILDKAIKMLKEKEHKSVEVLEKFKAGIR